jgi:hypothetical protein
MRIQTPNVKTRSLANNPEIRILTAARMKFARRTLTIGTGTDAKGWAKYPILGKSAKTLTTFAKQRSRTRRTMLSRPQVTATSPISN